VLSLSVTYVAPLYPDLFILICHLRMSMSISWAKRRNFMIMRRNPVQVQEDEKEEDEEKD
jgi:hypothetical protein